MMQISKPEAASLALYESTIERGLQTFKEVGGALLAIRDERLYRQDYATFEDYCRQRWGMSKTNANRLVQAAEVVDNLTPMGVIPTTERQTRPLTSLPPEEQREAWQEAVETATNNQPTAAIVQDVVDRRNGINRVTSLTGEESYNTPTEYIEAARVVMGSIDTDPASNNLAQETVQAAAFYTKETDGLNRTHSPWSGNVWLNPPYSYPAVELFMQRIIWEFGCKTISAAIVLVNNATDTKWFQFCATYANAICFTTGRINFYTDTRDKTSPTQGQAFLYYGDNVQRFVEHFKMFGFIATEIQGVIHE